MSPCDARECGNVRGGEPMKSVYPRAFPGFVLCSILIAVAACQSSPATTYVPPPETPVVRGIPIDQIVADLRTKLIERQIQEGAMVHVAIIRYTTPSGLSRTFGRYLGQKIGEGLSKSSGILLVDPGQVYEALHRMGLEQGILDTKTLLEVGQMVGADVLVIGTYTDLGQEIDVQSRLVTTPDGRQLASISQKIPITPEVLNLIKVGP